MKNSRLKGAAFLCAILLAVFASTAHAQKSGAWYWGDGDGSGSMGGPDLTVLYAVIANPSVNDTSIYTGYPQSRFRQDLNGDGSISGPDANILYPWLAGNYSNHPGTPDRLLLDGNTHPRVVLGDSVTLQAYAFAPAAQGSVLRTGLGVNFSITGGTCAAGAEIYGYNVAGGATVNAWRNPSAYHYLPTRLAPDNGRAWVKVRGNSCTDGQTTIIKVYIPSDAHSGAPGSRFPSDLVAQLSPTNSAPVNFTITWDTHPQTSINSHPPVMSNSTNATFSFSCDQSSCTYECNLDSLGWSSCSSPSGYNGLAAGAHLFSVRATSGGQTDPTPPSYAWTIDTTPPETQITAQPASLSNSSSASFSFNCSDASTPCSFQCSMDSGGYSSCASPQSYTSLSEGTHTFYVIATDAAGNPDLTPASYTWTIDLTPPDTIITASPSNPTNQTSASFSFTCTGGPCTFSCSIDSGAFTSCTSPANYSGLSAASHAFQVQAIDAANNADASPASYNWIIDLSPPDTFITSGPTDPTTQFSATFAFTCNETSCHYECKLDSSSWSPCASPNNYQSSFWSPTRADVPSARQNHTAVWTGTEMIVWGGEDATGDVRTGGRYNPVTDSWTPTSTGTNVPTGREDHSAVWTGTEMIIWGGGSYLNTGGRYNPATNSWTPTSTGANVPTGREDHSAVWTGTEMIVWGGSGVGGSLNTGGRYNPVSDSWTPTSTGANVPSIRHYHTAVWTGSEMIVWGGWNGSNLNTGGRYNPATDSWIPTSTGTNVPTGRQYQSAVWTSTEMIVWGGYYYDGSSNFLNSGGRYTPATNSWTPTSIGANVPTARYHHTAVWTGDQMIVWGGVSAGGITPAYLYTGGRYTPATDSWTPTSVALGLSGRDSHTAVWTGSEMIVWGGYFWPNHLNTGGRYNPGTDSWTLTSTGTWVPPGREYHTAVWTGTEMIVWGGGGGESDNVGYVNTGGRYNPVTDSWTATSTINAPSARDQQTAVWTGTQMIVWGGYFYTSTGYTGLFNDGGRYAPATNSWTPTSTGANVPSGRSWHTAVWTGSEMIVWGGGIASWTNTGGRYNPGTDSWTPTSMTNVPTARDGHTAVWAPERTEMIVWGGYPYTNTGGRYNPATDSWTATSTGTNVPIARDDHTAVWTGTEMIVWGGQDSSYSELNTGGRYTPGTDSWTPTSTGANVPIARYEHTAVWTRSEMIVWGGYPGGYSNTNTGGRYNPGTDSWIPTPVDANVPSGMVAHTAVWTGTEMIVWGGEEGGNTGGRLAFRTEGSHTFYVRAIDAANNVDPTPASYNWTISP